jgi:hypothetical protein
MPDHEYFIELAGAKFKVVKSKYIKKSDGSEFFVVELSNDEVGNCVVFCKDEIPTRLVLDKDFTNMRLRVKAVGTPVVQVVKEVS